MAVGGISIEDPSLFTYSGRWYQFVAIMSNPDKSVEDQILDNKHLELFEYTNEINSLCLYGNIKYFDVDGSISRFFNRIDNRITVMCRQMKKVSDGSTPDGNTNEMFVPFGRGDGQDVFEHTFIVQNIGILNRDRQNITYHISFISSNWYQLCSRITFSNYAVITKVEGANKNEKPVNGYLMLNKFLVDAFKNKKSVKVNEQSFKDAADSSNEIEIPYMTNGNDTVFSVMPYIFDRLYYHNKQIDKTLKFVVFDPVSNTYKCVDYCKTKSWSVCAKPAILLSMFETTYEQDLFSVNNNFGAVVAKPQTQTYEDMFSHILWKYDPATGSISSEDYALQTKDIVGLYNRRPDTFNKIKGVEVKNKYPEILNTVLFTERNSYYKQSTMWNNDFSLYQNMLDNLMKRDALVINTDGDITHQPGCCMGIILDRTLEKVPEMTAEQRKELLEKHRQIEALFPVLKVQHMYHLANRKDAPASYTENVVLGRNFILPPPVEKNQIQTIASAFVGFVKNVVSKISK